MEVEDLKYCKICLVTDVALSSSPSILDAYSQLVQVILCEEYQLYVCYECKHLLNKYQGFRFKCLTALNVLSCFNVDHSKITKKDVQDIDRKYYNLESKLACSPILICSSDDQDVLPSYCDNADVKLKDGFNPVVTIEPEIEFKLTRVPINIETKAEDTNDSNEILLVSNDYLSDDNDIVPEIKTHQKCLPKLTKKEYAIKVIPFKTISKKQPVNTLMKKLNTQLKTLVHPKTSQWLNKVKEHADMVILTPEEARKDILIKRDSTNYKNNPYKCDLCYMGFGLKSTFDNHMKKHNSDLGNYECEYCHRWFEKKKFLQSHITNCHKYKFHCKICPHVSRGLTQLDQHINLHKGCNYPCEVCGAVFRFSHCLTNHKRAKHPGCVCELCGSMCVSKIGLVRHKAIIHKLENVELMGPKCEECDVQFATETAWKRHLVLSVRHKVQHGCEKCGKTFSSSVDLKNHSKVHARRFINCKVCDTWLRTRKEFKDHMTSQHPQFDAAEVIEKIEAEKQAQFVCEVCGRIFKKEILLKYHGYKHTGERPYECKQCGKSYTTPYVLYLHKKNLHTHSGVFQCDSCQKVYSNKNALGKHIKAAHLGVRSNKCPFCDKDFIETSYLKSHIDYVHYKKPWPKRVRTNRRTNKYNMT